jgi:hypothetical protein
MSKNTGSKFDFSAFDADPSLSDRRSISIPPQTEFVRIEQRSSGLAPIGQIDLEGQAYRGLTRGSHWWLIITGWFVLGLPALLLGGMVIHSLFHSLANIPAPLAFPGIVNAGIALILIAFSFAVSGAILIILIRGTRAKLRHDRRRQIRRWITSPAKHRATR